MFLIAKDAHLTCFLARALREERSFQGDKKNEVYKNVSSYDSNSIAYDSGKKDKAPCCIRFARKIILWVNVGLSVLAIVIIALGIYSYTSGSVKYVGEVNSALFALALALGILILIISVLGCVAAKTSSQWVLICYVVGLGLALVFEIVIASLVFNPQHLKGIMKQRWDHLSDSERSNFENEFHCCGFDGTSYSSGSSQGVVNASLATSTTSCPGCYHEIQKSLHNVQMALGALAILLICYEFAMFAVSMFVFWSNKQKSKESVPDYDNRI
ncbi:tetraspanin-31 A [Reticulomyxa filosa]|uniref:Tetraspanin-31 A n=1 Tax=Reticulomyxa filosa TaxID=46433 RepID=X6NUW6_RETFI|nr:tetraspanin-31 A [Reticulomyxa filosa]|eukprot:ETO30100.1 tetraspanin-31 A [Reticulomyxa filosa]